MKKNKRNNHMSITHIKTNKKIEVLLRLLENKESLEDASSKAGLNIEKTRLIINNKIVKLLISSKIILTSRYVK